MKNYYDIIFIAGAPGTGKSSVAKLLQKELDAPCFEFGWIPEFRNKGDNIIPYEEEEGLAFENLTLVAKNYIKHGFKNIIVTDLEDKRIKELHQNFKKEKYILFTLTVRDDETLKERIMNETRSSEYRNWKQAIKINQDILGRSLLPNEIRIDATEKSIGNVIKDISEYLNQ